MSSRACDYLGRVLEGREDFASDIAFEAADHLSLAHSLGGAPPHVCVGPAIMAESDHNDAIESRIGLTIPTSVKGGVILGHGVSTLSDYVRLSVKGKCPLSRLPC